MHASQVKITLKKVGCDLRETEETPGKEKKEKMNTEEKQTRKK